MSAATLGRPAKTSRDALLRAAGEIGFVDLTVGAVTRRSGVKYSTFYRHFEHGIDEMLAALVDDAFARAPGPLPDLATEWTAHLAGTGATLRRLLHGNPGMAQALTRLPRAPLALVEVRARAEEIVTRAGFNPSDAYAGVGTVLALALGDPDRTNQHAVPLVIDGLAARLARAVPEQTR